MPQPVVQAQQVVKGEAGGDVFVDLADGMEPDSKKKTGISYKGAGARGESSMGLVAMQGYCVNQN